MLLLNISKMMQRKGGRGHLLNRSTTAPYNVMYYVSISAESRCILIHPFHRYLGQGANRDSYR